VKIIKPYIEIQNDMMFFSEDQILKKIEQAGRTCYKSEDKITTNSAEDFVRRVIASGHESVIEHGYVTFKVVCDRGVTHEIVRHRIASYSQESTRYCNYSKDKFGRELTFIKPCFWNEDSKQYEFWKMAMQDAEYHYLTLIEKQATAQEARSVLPNSLKTEIVITMNLREWRHFLKLRTSTKAHPQMREIAIMIYDWFKEVMPVIVDDIQV